MEGALIILGVTVVVGVILYLADRMRHKHKKDGSAGAELPRQEEAEAERLEAEPLSSTAGKHGPLCCGQHLVCEKYPPTDKIIYYDDEELDRFAGRSGDDYTDEEIEEFQEVLMTLRPEDALGWSRSVEQRHIALPPDVRDGLMLLITEG
jgi:hypothetical protein